MADAAAGSYDCTATTDSQGSAAVLCLSGLLRLMLNEPFK